MKIQEILKQPEGKTLEFKKELPKNRQNLLKIVVAFANGAGGNIYVGVNDDHTVTGIMRIKEACRTNALPEPKFEETGNFFKMTGDRIQERGNRKEEIGKRK
jgi:predicted HTH transcriptional regulator